MKNLLILTIIIIITQIASVCEASVTTDVKVISKDNKYYGLATSDGSVIVEAKYKKVIKLGNNAWIIQNKANKFGLMDNKGKILVPIKFRHAERLFDKWVKLGNDGDYGIYDEKGAVVVPPEFKAIEPLFGGKFLTYKNYKYGIYSNTGEKILNNEYDLIYMPSPKITRIKKGNDFIEVERITEKEAKELKNEEIKKYNDEHFKITHLFKNTGYSAGYSVLTATDYTLKAFSSVSRAYEDTIDELMLSQGVDTVSIFMKLNWIPRFPIIYAKKYGSNLMHPNEGPLAEIRNELKEQIK